MKKFFYSLMLLILCLTACATQQPLEENDSRTDIVQIKTRLFFQKWNTKGIGESLQNNTILINPEDFKTDKITIVRLSKGERVKEVYHKDETDPSGDTWVFTTKNLEDKTLVHQFATTYMITQRVPGKKGGSLKERFEIPNN